MSFYRSVAFGAKGMLNFTRSAFLSRRKKFEAEEAAFLASPAAQAAAARGPALADAVVLITGANSGIGRAAAESLATQGAREVHLVCRNAERGQAARDEIAEASGNAGVVLHLLDLSDVVAVKAFARQFVASGRALDVCVNNAGAMINERRETEHGFEANFAVNTLGTYVLTEELMPALLRSALARVITVSSGGMLTQNLVVDDLQSAKVEPFDGTTVYAINKRQQVCLTEHWARVSQARDVPVVFQSMHPGWVDTPALQNSMPDFYERTKDKLRTPEEGADSIVWLATSNRALELDAGSFVLDRAPQKKHLLGARTSYTQEEVDELVAALDGCAERVGDPTEEALGQFAYLLAANNNDDDDEQ